MPFAYEHPRPALTVDCVVLGVDGGGLKVLLIQRDGEPFAGRWALPGGFVEMDETLEHAARRELQEETGLTDVVLEQLGTFGDIHRDPRERVVSVVYIGQVRSMPRNIQAASDARRVEWFGVDDVPPLAFDHAAVLALAVQRHRDGVQAQTVDGELQEEMT